jgi:hypothetical protein
LPAPHEATRSVAGAGNVPEQRRGNGARRNDLAVAEAEPPTGDEARTGLLCAVKPYTINFFTNILFPVVFVNKDNQKQYACLLTKQLICHFLSVPYTDQYHLHLKYIQLYVAESLCQ